jgi:hypothetical protein
MALYEDSSKVMLPIFVKCALKLQNFAIFEIGVDYVQIPIRPEDETS